MNFCKAIVDIVWAIPENDLTNNEIKRVVSLFSGSKMQSLPLSAKSIAVFFML